MAGGKTVKELRQLHKALGAGDGTRRARTRSDIVGELRALASDLARDLPAKAAAPAAKPAKAATPGAKKPKAAAPATKPAKAATPAPSSYRSRLFGRGPAAGRGGK